MVSQKFSKNTALVLVHIAGSQTEYVIYVNDDTEGPKLVTLSVSLWWLNENWSSKGVDTDQTVG